MEIQMKNSDQIEVRLYLTKAFGGPAYITFPVPKTAVQRTVFVPVKITE